MFAYNRNEVNSSGFEPEGGKLLGRVEVLLRYKFARFNLLLTEQVFAEKRCVGTNSIFFPSHIDALKNQQQRELSHLYCCFP